MSNNPFNVINPANPMNNNRIGQMKNMMQMFRNSKNPVALFQQMAMQNPRMRPALNMMNQGMSPQQIFENVCRQQGIDPNEFIKMINGK